MIKVKVQIEVEAPEGATHYSGNLLEWPTWWKHIVNSTEAIKGWCCYDYDRQEWMFNGECASPFLKDIKEINVETLP